MNQTTQTQTQNRRFSKEQLVITESVATSGAVSYWRLSGDVKLDVLASAWRAAGLDEKLLPTAVKNEVALGRAVADQAEKRRLIRPLARRGAWAIVDETVVEGQAPTYRTLVTVRLGDTGADVEAVSASDDEAYFIRTAIGGAYLQHRNKLAHHDISAWLLDIAYGLKAVSLRESGGVYFIPNAGVDMWSKVADAVTAGGAGDVFRIPAMRTAEAVAAITAAITAEAAVMAQKIEDEIMATGDDAIGKRALKNRVKDSMALLDKLASYEELLGRQLDIRARVEALSANVSAAVLTASESEAT